jgi:two-component system, LytTR family, sensor histidine kinase AlgZ
MHPIFTDGKQLGLYIFGYLPIGAVLVIGFGHADAWGTAAAFFLPLTVLYGFLGMTAYYVCRAFPINQHHRLWRALPALSMAALTAGAFSVGIAWGWAAILESLNLNVHPKMYLDQPWTLFAVGVLLFGLSIAFHYALIASLDAQRSESQMLESKLLVRDAELKALRAQLNPHFLFNSLNSVSALTASDPAGARHMCLLLADFLRDTLRLGSAQRITVREEFTVLQRYLAIEQVRLGSRLSVACGGSEQAMQETIPALLLQPLVENAVVHGIAHRLEGGAVSIHAEISDSALLISVANPVDADRPRGQGNGFGLNLVRQRLQVYYGASYAFAATEVDGVYRVEIHLPLATGELQA